MEFFTLENPILTGVVGTAFGSVVTLIIRYFLNRRGLFIYTVEHLHIGISASDPTLGTTTVNWNGRPVDKLFTSTVQLKNSSLKDYSDVDVCVFSNNTTLLTEITSIAGTTKSLHWTDTYSGLVSSIDDEAHRIDLITSRREYNIPTMNRGQVVRFTILNEPKSDQPPELWLEILHQGVRVKFKVIQPEILGVPRPLAVIVGLVFSAVFLGAVVIFINEVWLAAALCLAFGLIVVVPGAYAIKVGRWVRSVLGD